MYADYIDKTLIVDPNYDFNRLAKVMADLGWRRERPSTDQKPLVADEPEVASWSCAGAKPYIIYTYNPVVSLRVLDVETLPPELRAGLIEKIPTIDSTVIQQWISSTEPRDRLRAVWCAKEIENLSFIEPLNALIDDGEKVVAREARAAQGKLLKVETAREQVFVSLKILESSIAQFIPRLSDPNFVAGLKPDRATLISLFDEQFTDLLSNVVDRVYYPGLCIDNFEADTCIDVFPCPAEFLRAPNPYSEKFPGGYRVIAGWLKTSPIWVAWTQTSANGDTLRYDGLVWANERWVWLPKIFRYLSPYLFNHSANQQKH